MIPLAHGVDMVACERLEEAVTRHGDRFMDRVFTDSEKAYCAGRKRRMEHLAGRFAAKEAVLKVLGTGWQNGIAWTDIEIVNLPSGQPEVRLSGRCKEIADGLGLTRILISISHIETHAIASAIGFDGSAGNKP
jgi:holo-[acyl-carrier protein] synthase